MNGAREFNLLVGQITIDVVAELLAENEDAVERRTQLMRHVREEFRFVFRRQREFRRLFFECAAGAFDFLVLCFDFHVTFGELLRLLLELLICRLQFCLLVLQFARELLALFQQAFGLHRRFDTVQNDADACGELFEEVQVRAVKFVQRRDRNDRLQFILEVDRQHDDAARHGVEQRRPNADGRLRHFCNQNAATLNRTLTDEAFAKRNCRRIALIRDVGIGAEQGQARRFIGRHLIDDALVATNEWHELRQQFAADGCEVALALQQASETREIGFEPVLFGVAVGR